MSQRGTIIKSGIWYTVSNYLIKGLDFLTIPIFARILSVSEYGSYNNFVSCLQLFYVMGSICIDASFISARFDYKNELKKYTKNALISANICTIILIGVSIVLYDGIQSLFNIDVFMLFFIILYCFFRPSLDVFQQIERFNYNYKKCVFVSSLVSISSVVFSLLLVNCSPNRLDARIIGTYIPIIVISLYFYFSYLWNDFSFEREQIKYAFKICLPYVPHSLAITVLASSDRIMINYFHDSSQVAYYSIAYTCGIALSILANSLNNAFVPWLGDRIYEGKVEIINRTSKWYILVFYLPLLFIVTFSPEVLYVLGGKQYSEAMYVMPPVLISCFIQFIYSLFVDVEQLEKKTKGMALASVIAAVVNIILNYIYVPSFGYIAAAYTTLISYVCLMLFHWFIIKRIGYSKAYNIKFIFALIIIMTLYVICISTLYYSLWIRGLICLIVVLIALVIGIKQKEKIITTTK